MLTTALPFTTGSGLFCNFLSLSTPSWSSAQRGTQKIFFNPSGQNPDGTEMMSVDIRGFTGVTRFLMQLFYPRHLFCLLGYLDSISNQQISVVDGDKRAVAQDDAVPFFQDIIELPGESPEK